jgi:uncharacterized protein YxjI
MPVLLDHTKFVVKSQSQKFSSKKSFEIANGKTGQKLGTGTDTTPFFSSLLGAVTIEVRDASNNNVVFTVRRSGWLFKKDEVLDPKEQVVGSYKGKRFSLSGGYHVYDKAGKHLADVQGKMLKAEYKIVTPDKSAEMGSVSRTWTGLAKSLATGDDTYGVQIAPKCAEDAAAKQLILGLSLAVESIFKKAAGKGSESGGGDSGGGGDDE